MAKKKFLKPLSCLALASMFALVGLTTACDGGGTTSDNTTENPEVKKCTLTWTVDENVTVTIDDYQTRPTEVNSGTKLSFTVTPKTGYEVTSVKLNGKRQTAKNGKYTVTISAKATIVIEASAKIQKIEVTKNPTKLKYFAGDALDTTGMEVKVFYETGKEEVIEQSVDGYAVSPAIFEGGETSFKVIYGEKEVFVNLEDRVDYLVSIDPKGGTISDSWVGELRSLSLKNYAVSDAGVVTFSYFNDLPKEIKLPTAEQITKEDNTFKGWSDNTKVINNEVKKSSKVEAQWQPELVTLSSVELKVEENKPYLIIKGTYKAANKVYLYLYEGNKKISLTADTYEGNRDEEFIVKFDLTRLKDAKTESGETFEGAWMDIRFNADDGKGNKETMEIFTDVVTVDTNQKIKVGNYTYLFATYEGALKVYYTIATLDYNVSFVQEGEGDSTKDYLKINGTIKDNKYFGKTVQISWFQGSETPFDYGVISNTGTFEVKVDLADIVTATNGFAHFAIVESEEDKTILFGGTDNNLKVADCSTTFPALEGKPAGNDITNALRHVANDGYSYYVGYAWDGLMVYKVDEQRTMSFENITLDLVDGKVCYVISGKYKGYTAADLKFGLDLQHNANIEGSGSWDYVYNDKKDDKVTYSQQAIVDEANGTFRIVFALSDLDSTFTNLTSWTLTPHYYFLDATAKDIKGNYTNKNIVKNGYEYSLRCDRDTWDTVSIVINKTDAADSTIDDLNKSYSVTGTSLEEKDGKAQFVVSGTYASYSAAEIKEIAEKTYFDLQKNPYAVTGSWDGDWSTISEFNKVAEVNETDKTFKLYIDISAVENYKYTTHMNFGRTVSAEYKPATAINQTITVGNKNYTMIVVPNSEDGAQFWGAVGIIIEDAAQ